MSSTQAKEDERSGEELSEIVSGPADSSGGEPSLISTKEGREPLTLSHSDYALIPRNLHAGIRKANEKSNVLPSAPTTVNNRHNGATCEDDSIDVALVPASSTQPLGNFSQPPRLLRKVTAVSQLRAQFQHSS